MSICVIILTENIKMMKMSQQASGQSFFLVEAVIDVATKLLRIVTKVEDSSLVQQFDTYLRACLEEEWIEAH